MKMNWPVRPRNSRRSRSMSSGVKAMKSTTASHERPPRAAAAAFSSRKSAFSVVAPAGAAVFPRMKSVTSWPRASASLVQAVEMIPVPPMNKMRMGFPFQSMWYGASTMVGLPVAGKRRRRAAAEAQSTRP
jgi:hypothetical protein